MVYFRGGKVRGLKADFQLSFFFTTNLTTNNFTFVIL